MFIWKAPMPLILLYDDINCAIIFFLFSPSSWNFPSTLSFTEFDAINGSNKIFLEQRNIIFIIITLIFASNWLKITWRTTLIFNSAKWFIRIWKLLNNPIIRKKMEKEHPYLLICRCRWNNVIQLISSLYWQKRKIKYSPINFIADFYGI